MHFNEKVSEGYQEINMGLQGEEEATRNKQMCHSNHSIVHLDYSNKALHGKCGGLISLKMFFEV